MSKQQKSSGNPFPLKTTEAQLERQCSDLLALDGWRSLKTDPVSDKSRGKGFGELGMPDRLYIRYLDGARIDVPHSAGWGVTTVVLKSPAAEVLWIEWKSARGRAKPHQLNWHAAELGRGALVLLAGRDFPAHFEGFCAWYAESGLMRRAGLCGGQAT